MTQRYESFGYRRDGVCFCFEMAIAKFRCEDAWQLILILRDVTAPEKTPLAGIQASHHDALTGLPNRTLLRQHLSAAMQQLKGGDQRVALLYVALDGIELIHQQHGAETVNWLLKEVACRLRAQVRESDTVARLSDHEFVVLCDPSDQATALFVVTERVCVKLQQHYHKHGGFLPVAVSIGVVIDNAIDHLREGGDAGADSLLRQTETAIFAEKQDQQNQQDQQGDTDQETPAAAREPVCFDVDIAILRKELTATFQPIVVAETGRIVGAELLLRWHSPEGEVNPSVFIPIAEATGAIMPLGTWAFRQACLAEVHWRKRWSGNAPYVSLNISPHQLHHASLIDDFSAVLRQTGANPARILLEIMEEALMTGVDRHIEALRRLACLGLRVAVDNFGAGYTSLSQLTRMPIDILKIDKALIDSLHHSSESRAAISGVVGLGRALGMKLVAKGAESRAQQLDLCSLGCDFIQGNHFYPALTAPDFIATMEHAQHQTAPATTLGLYFVLYVSRCTEPMSDRDIETMLAKARQHNRALGLTGCLIHQNGTFMQMIEGRRDVVSDLLSKIEADPRHRDVRIVIEGVARNRVFSHWSMALHDYMPRLDDPQCVTRQPDEGIDFFELAKDMRACYAYMTAAMRAGIAC
jgi:diguanylate cyclase (GGDEF)-like protein